MAKKMINIRLDEDLWKRAKVDAAIQGMTLQDWITLAGIRLLDDNQRGDVSREYVNRYEGVAK